MHHQFSARLEWTGNVGTGTSSYTGYDRSHTLHVDGKEPLACSSAPVFRGDGTLYNPEDMLLYSVAACHMLWFLHCCADAGVVVTAYTDTAEGTMATDSDDVVRFTEIILHPRVVLADPSRAGQLPALHERAHQQCFIANSLRTPVVIR